MDIGGFLAAFDGALGGALGELTPTRSRDQVPRVLPGSQLASLAALVHFAVQCRRFHPKTDGRSTCTSFAGLCFT